MQEAKEAEKRPSNWGIVMELWLTATDGQIRWWTISKRFSGACGLQDSSKDQT